MKICLISVFAFFIFSLPIFGQVNDEIDVNSRKVPYDVENVVFVLDGTPTPDAVGFDSPKSYWKFSYELRFLDDIHKEFELQETLGTKLKDRSDKPVSTSKLNKLIAREVRKISILVTKGKIKKRPLTTARNRELLIPVKLTPQIQQIIARSAGSNKNPEFVISVKGKLYTRTSSGLKFKEKYAARFPCSVKIESIDQKLYWASNRCGVSLEVMNENNTIRFGMFSRL
ncbi:MAG: hypothetical protein IT173_09805 [Acidobacteria bacterium]|nr:hypothetical protein [Acidobacteriota bacterium]